MSRPTQYASVTGLTQSHTFPHHRALSHPLTTMPPKFKVGDHVTWNSEAGHVSGTIIKVHTSDFEPPRVYRRLGGLSDQAATGAA